MFRGRRRFVVFNKPGMLWLERVRASNFVGNVAHYSVGDVEKKTIRVLRRGTRRDVLRARKLLEGGCTPWTRVEWGKDGRPTYVYDAKRFPKTPKRKS